MSKSSHLWEHELDGMVANDCQVTLLGREKILVGGVETRSSCDATGK